MEARILCVPSSVVGVVVLVGVPIHAAGVVYVTLDSFGVGRM